MPLSDTSARNAKPLDKPYKLSDGGGLFLLVNPSGSKYWRLKYRINGKEKLLSLGVYPQVSLKAAREKRDEIKAFIAQGIDPSIERKRSVYDGEQETFEKVAVKYCAKVHQVVR